MVWCLVLISDPKHQTPNPDSQRRKTDAADLCGAHFDLLEVAVRGAVLLDLGAEGVVRAVGHDALLVQQREDPCPLPLHQLDALCGQRAVKTERARCVR
eukprot:2425729-Rhodomonas_salina.3